MRYALLHAWRLACAAALLAASPATAGAAQDYVALSVEGAAAPVAANGLLEVEWSASNDGAEPVEALSYAILLSPNFIVTEADLVIHQGVVSIGAGSEASRVEQIELGGSVAAGTYRIGLLVDDLSVLDETDEANNLAVGAGEIPILPAVRMVTEEFSTIFVGEEWCGELVATGGDGTYRWEIVEGGLPVGIELLEDGTLCGRPLAATADPVVFSLRVSSAGGADRRMFALDVAHRPDFILECLGSELPAGVIGTYYEAEVEVGGSPGPVTFTTLESRRLGDVFGEEQVWQDEPPPGLSLDTEGRVSGMPALAGRYEWSVAVEGEVAETFCELSLVVTGERLPLDAIELPAAQVGVPYEAQLEPATWRWGLLEGGELPEGLQLEEDGRLHGVVAESVLPEGESGMVWSLTFSAFDEVGRAGVLTAGLRIDAAGSEDAPSARGGEPAGGCSAGGAASPFALASALWALRRWRQRGQ